MNAKKKPEDKTHDNDNLSKAEMREAALRHVFAGWAHSDSLADAHMVAFELGALVGNNVSDYERAKRVQEFHLRIRNVSEDHWRDIHLSFSAGRATNIGRDNLTRRYQAKGASKNPTIKATPFVYVDPKAIPKRECLYGGHLYRKYMSTTFGAGGSGKSTVKIVEALAMATGKPLLGHLPEKPLRVWIVNLEDPLEETQRKLVAAMKHFGIKPEELGDRLLVDSGRDQSFVVLKNDGRGTTIVEPVVSAIINEMIDKEIDVLFLDPFISTHAVEENDNGKIQQVAEQWVRVANATNAAVELVHHVNKSAGDGRAEVTAESGRGAGALKDKARSVHTINGMTAQEAEKAGIDANDRFDYFRVNNGKSNLARRTGHADWRRLVSVDLGNGGNFYTPGDSVGVATPWRWPSEAVTDVPAEQLAEIKRRISAGQFKAHWLAADWAGFVFAAVMGIELRDNAGKRRLDGTIQRLISDGHFRIVHRADKTRHEKPYLEVAAPVSEDTDAE
ncbi:AAA family ATPase [Tardiphaga sp. 839_C3_N1_4]|uniref:AAA family ATPase n=1 Tax=Tardiphaga sp. 839_C3_N1_4 TaxID=3240761 RepID=UPI003F299EF8